jgi:mRNA interferase RelE/StbE
MHYELEIMKKAVRDLQDIDRTTAARILGKLESLQNDLSGDVKRLTNFTPEYRLRVGDFRVLFAISGHYCPVRCPTTARSYRHRSA